MVLLTSSQVSAAISGGIFLAFTALLFLSGFVLQQQSVKGIQAIVKPRIPTRIQPLSAPAPTSQNPLFRAARPLGQHLPSPYQYLHSAPAHPAVRWSRLAHAQVVRSHVEVCTAVMVFAELAKQRSPAARVLLFPRTWTVDKSEEADPLLVRTRRLMRTAARRWNVSLRPMEPIGHGAERSVDESLPSSYSLASLWELSEFERVLHLKGPGVLVDAEALDALLAFAELGDRPVAGIPDESKGTVDGEEVEQKLSTSMLLVQPSMATYHQLKQRRAAHPVPDLSLLREAFPGPSALLSPLTTPYFTPSILSSTPHLRRIPPGPPLASIDPSLVNPNAFNGTYFLLTTSYIQINDPEIPGPEYDVPLREREKWQPLNPDAKQVWERMYQVFRGRRMDVCMLDLEGWQKPSIGVAERGAEL